MNKIKKGINFLGEVKTEIKKVNWPTRKETTRYTLIVIGISFALATYLGALDFIFSFLLRTFVI
ncbi:MAG: preprotein translocase subunit SecE [Candidatus Pacebacteria bacterium]|jgi:preprotein translocase subunit SecE|nr:preprotein translocase subunit SecE [Candidatus Paceibacterota bacterium]MDD3072104.1 preprotein translocase subunit SecE [Candidatus Paceibacterota bacterium]MDD3728831.1 preprotein translocase subunit SecE [Candidatus Paceibacterota bacterium]MDD4201310.1 preprotein translocase subunit SecE [Candidatus Paceibacterota bacterium]MDD4467289.1 preprotein translocase subunit SecE [Candidatus Paceibacterota bacterium]